MGTDVRAARVPLQALRSCRSATCRLGLVLVTSVVALVGCVKEPFRPDPRFGHLGTKAIVDDSPAWSPDGRFIAYHRAFISSDGPPGVYLISRDGGKPHQITGGDY